MSQSLAPKQFAGLFGTAPTALIVGLAITLIGIATRDAKDASLGMITGSAASRTWSLRLGSRAKEPRCVL